ncbi:MAG: autotransporter domain-containing protein [Alphaproteobacteria bacterium]|nr:autotransporter domain-containing protein [Alphaproteobacteria bacterium]
MRIRRKIQLAGLAVALAGGVSGTAEAGDRSVDTGITTPLTTSNPDGSSVQGNITVTSPGSITVGAGQSAVTVNTSNSVSNAGTLTATVNANNVNGILIQGGNSGTVTNTGGISLVEDYVITDTDNDGNLDGNVAVGTNRHGIFLQAGPTFTGDIVNSGIITIEGNNSSGITLNSLLTGNLRSTGTINVVGDNSYGIAVNNGVTGNVTIAGGGQIRGQNTVGIAVNGNIGGELSVNGTWNVLGYLSTIVPSNQTTLDPDDLEQSGAALLVRANVANGITIEGIGVENDTNDDHDGDSNEADDNNTAQITVYGSAPVILIQANGSNLTVGPGTEGYGLLVRGQLVSNGLYDGISATGVRIQGDGLGATATINGGVSIDYGISTTANEANAQGLVFGQDSISSLLQVRGIITTNVVADTLFTSRGIVLESGANVPTFNNSGTVQAFFFGENGNAVAVSDASGTLLNVTNTGQVLAQLVATDDDLTDDILPPTPVGNTIAFDLSNASGGVLIQQLAPVVFTDDDAVDDLVASTPRIAGDVRLGAFADTFNIFAGTVAGNISFGNGADALNINNGGAYTGRITDTDGALAINVQQGTLSYTGGTLNITSATFGANSVFNATLTGVPATTTNIIASGAVTFAPGARVNPVVPAGLPTFGTQTFLTANGGMFGAANVVGAVNSSNAPYLYSVNIGTTNPIVEGANNALTATFQLRTPAQLGLSANQAIAFDPILAALRLDTGAAAALAGISSQYEFFDAYEDLLPNYADGATEVAATAIQQMQSATSNRMSSVRMQGLDEVSVWGQEIAYGLNREPPNTNAQEFRGQGFGFAAGIDGPTDNGALFGLSVSFIASEVEEPGRPQGQISSWFTQANAYYATALGPVDLDFIAGIGGGKLTSQRYVEIGNPVAFSALTEADWMAYEGHGAIRASVPLAVSEMFTVTPQAALTYAGISEEGYEEEGGGPAIDYRVDSVFSQRLWADVGVEFAANLHFGQQTVISPRIYGGYRANVLDEGADRTVAFVSTGTQFTLNDGGVGQGGPVIGIGVDATNGYSTFSLGYEGEFGDQIERHSLNAAIRFRF